MTPQQWLLSERDYTTGCRLYDVLGDNLVLKRTLASGPSKYNVEALAWELQKLARAGVATSVPSVPVSPENVQIAAKTAEPVREIDESVHEELESTRQELDDMRQDLEQAEYELEQQAEKDAHAVLLEQLQQERGPLYDERTHLHAQLEHVDELTRLQYAQRIQALSRAIDKTWAAAAHVREYGRLPDPVAPAFDIQGASLDKLISHRANVRSNVSKLKKKPLRVDDLAAAEAECALLTARIDDLKGKEGNRG